VFFYDASDKEIDKMYIEKLSFAGKISWRSPSFRIVNAFKNSLGIWGMIDTG
jgi:hypothetical protein